MPDLGSGLIVFVDESGDHGLANIDPASPVFVLAFCVVGKTEYANAIVPALTYFKFKHFGHDQVILHEREIRKDLGDFAVLRNPDAKAAFLEELTNLIAGLPFCVIASVIRKGRLVGQYSKPENPYEVALGFGLERIRRYAMRKGVGGQPIPVVLERRGKREDDELELEFRRICAGANYSGEELPFEPRFVSKLANVPGLQLADLIARPIGRHVCNPSQANRAFDAIEPHLDRSPSGSIKGWGLKVFP